MKLLYHAAGDEHALFKLEGTDFSLKMEYTASLRDCQLLLCGVEYMQKH